MPWWAWITVGALLLVAELTIVDLEFYLVLLGVSALTVGALELAGIALPVWVQWLVFAFLSVTSLVVFRRRVYGWLRPPSTETISEGVEGAVATALESIAPGARGRVSLRGTSWTGVNRSAEPIAQGARCRVERSEGLVLELQPER